MKPIATATVRQAPRQAMAVQICSGPLEERLSARCTALGKQVEKWEQRCEGALKAQEKARALAEAERARCKLLEVEREARERHCEAAASAERRALVLAKAARERCSSLEAELAASERRSRAASVTWKKMQALIETREKSAWEKAECAMEERRSALEEGARALRRREARLLLAVALRAVEKSRRGSLLRAVQKWTMRTLRERDVERGLRLAWRSAARASRQRLASACGVWAALRRVSHRAEALRVLLASQRPTAAVRCQEPSVAVARSSHRAVSRARLLLRTLSGLVMRAQHLKLRHLWRTWTTDMRRVSSELSSESAGGPWEALGGGAREGRRRQCQDAVVRRLGMGSVGDSSGVVVEQSRRGAAGAVGIVALEPREHDCEGARGRCRRDERRQRRGKSLRVAGMQSGDIASVAHVGRFRRWRPGEIPAGLEQKEDCGKMRICVVQATGQMVQAQEYKEADEPSGWMVVVREQTSGRESACRVQDWESQAIDEQDTRIVIGVAESRRLQVSGCSGAEHRSCRGGALQSGDDHGPRCTRRDLSRVHIRE